MDVATAWNLVHQQPIIILLHLSFTYYRAAQGLSDKFNIFVLCLFLNKNLYSSCNGRNMYVSQGSVVMRLKCSDRFVIILLHIFQREWKNFENQSIFGEAVKWNYVPLFCRSVSDFGFFNIVTLCHIECGNCAKFAKRDSLNFSHVSVVRTSDF